MLCVRVGLHVPFSSYFVQIMRIILSNSDHELAPILLGLLQGEISPLQHRVQESLLAFDEESNYFDDAVEDSRGRHGSFGTPIGVDFSGSEDNSKVDIIADTVRLEMTSYHHD